MCDKGKLLLTQERRVRQPRDLRGLLRLSVEVTNKDGGPPTVQLVQLDVQRRVFLEEVLRTLTLDSKDTLSNCLAVVGNKQYITNFQFEEELPDRLQEAFDTLLDLVHDIDVAKDFFNIGGLDMFPICLTSENETIRALACSVLGDCCQNNPHCQTRALDAGLLPVLVDMVLSEEGGNLGSAIYALSCLCRGNEPACEEIVSKGLCAVVAEHLHDEHPRARSKAAFLLHHLASAFPPAREKLIEENIIETIALLIKKGHDLITEHLLSILQSLLENKDETVVQQLKDPQLGLQEILETYLKRPEMEDDTYKEEKKYCKELLEFLTSSPQVENVEEEGDR